MDNCSKFPIKTNKKQNKHTNLKNYDAAADNTIENKGKKLIFCNQEALSQRPKSHFNELSGEKNFKKVKSYQARKCKLIRKNSTNATNPFWAC